MLLRRALKDFVQEKHLCPPVSLKQLEELADEFVASLEFKILSSSNSNSPLSELVQCVAHRTEEFSIFNSQFSICSWLMVEIHNQLWLPVVTGIPHERRLLMLPKCLSKHGECKGEYDEYGLLCHRCGRCLIPSLQDKAEQLGSLSIVAEGFTQVIELIENNVVDAVIGVSCLESLEKAFPLLVKHAVPGLAIALNDSGCKDTHVDDAYVDELLSMLDEDVPPTLLDHDALREQVNRWFTRAELGHLMGKAEDQTSAVCLDWMCVDGKRWRPFLLCAVWQALTGKSEMTEDVHRAAVAVECFHKASLIHDDIEDSDKTRYGQPTIHALYGDAFAINAGDALLGEGYRILAESNNAELVRLIADAHMKLCKGQGMELVWCQHPEPIDMDFVKEVFRHKTVPAFEVSLMLGLSCTGNFVHLRPMLRRYSEALGMAYQMKDDLEDFMDDNELSSRPSAVLALRTEHPDWDDRRVKDELQQLIDHYHQEALDALNEVDSIELKRLLFQVTEKIIAPPAPAF